MLSGLLVGLCLGATFGAAAEHDEIVEAAPSSHRAEPPARTSKLATPRQRIVSEDSCAQPSAATAGLSTDDAGPTRETLLAQLRAAAAGDTTIDIGAVTTTLNQDHPGAHIPLELISALLRTGRPFRIDDFVKSFTDAELMTVLTTALTALADDGPSWVMAEQAAKHAVNDRSLEIDVSATRALLEHSVPEVRRAGLLFADRHRNDVEQDVRLIASSDPDFDARGEALAVYTDWNAEQALELVSDGLRHPSYLVHDEAANALLRLGEPGARIALEALASGDQDADGAISEELFTALLRAGLGGELLGRAPREEIQSGIVENLTSVVEETPAALDPVLPYVPELLRTGDIERARDLFGAMASAGKRNWLISYVGNTAHPAAYREAAFGVIDDGTDDNSYYDLAERVVWDDRATLEMRTSALWNIVRREGHREYAYQLQLKVVRTHALPPALRANAVETLAHVWPKDERSQRADACRVVWREVLDVDPSEFVRAEAHFRLTGSTR